MSHKYSVAMELEVEGENDSMDVAVEIAGLLRETAGFRFFNLSVEQDFEDGEKPFIPEAPPY